MKKITEYKIVSVGVSTQFLEEEVVNAIKEGWQPLGGAFSSEGKNYDYFNQMMVKYEA